MSESIVPRGQRLYRRSGPQEVLGEERKKKVREEGRKNEQTKERMKETESKEGKTDSCLYTLSKCLTILCFEAAVNQ